MPDVAWLLAFLALAAAFVLPPLLRRPIVGRESDAAEAAVVGYRVALDALRDVETDHHAGSLDDEAYASQRSAAEERAALARVERDATVAAAGSAHMLPDRRARRLALAGAAVIGAALLVGSLLPPPLGLAAGTVVNQELARAQAAEDARRQLIASLLEQLDADQPDVPTLSALADAYLAGDSRDDLAAAVRVLQVVISLAPDNLDAYRRTITAYLRAGDYANAEAALDAYAEIETDVAEVAFFRGLIALRGHDDADAAVEAFDEFLRLATTDDPRVTMVRALREEAAASSE